jgi:hypothetical protein
VPPLHPIVRGSLCLALLAGCARAPSPTAAAGPEAGPAGAPAAEPARPRPYPVPEPAGFTKAVEKGTRTRTGVPGPNYWQQWARYDLAADYDPATGRLDGTARIRYHNRSPDRLTTIPVHLYGNMFAPEAMRTRVVPVQPPMKVTRVAVRGEEIADKPAPGRASYRIAGTLLLLGLAQRPLEPGDSIDLEFAWQHQVPADGAPRGGRNDDVAWVSYWYPQVAVYDDVVGWQVDQYMGNGEFYMGYGDYDVAITVPAGHVVAATGELVNPEQVLPADVRERLARARATDSVVHVVPRDGLGAGRATLAGDKLTWRFRARAVRDVAFGTSAKWAWDASRADSTLIQAFWIVPDGGAPSNWEQEWRYARHSIEFLARYLWPYPYPHASAVQGPRSCGGMEFPMITCIGTGPQGQLYGVTVHELAHIWFPMQVGSDEKRHAWQDEGLTEFNQVQAEKDFHAREGTAPKDYEQPVRDAHLSIVKAGLEEPLMRHADKYENPGAFGIASYMKPAAALMALRGMLGDSAFMAAYRGYGRAWQWKHPKPVDLFNHFDTVAKRDLDWFWRTWFYETWPLDQAVAGVTPRNGGYEVVIEDKGMAPMPAPVVVTRADGSTERHVVPVETWLGGARRHALRLKGGQAVTKVEIDPEGHYPDVDRGNNAWPAGTAGR